MGIGAGLFLMFACVGKCIFTRYTGKVEEGIALDDMKTRHRTFASKYQEWKSSDSPGEKIHNFLMAHKLSDDVFTAIDVCKTLYEEETILNNGSTEMADMFFFDNLDSNEVTDFFYSHADKGLLPKIKIWCHKNIPTLIKPWEFLEQILPLKKVWIFSLGVLKTSLHYIDLVKDILLLSILWNYITDSEGSILMTPYHDFPRVLTLVMLSSILLTEACGALVLASSSLFQDMGIAKRCLCLLLTPLMPAFCLFEEMMTKIAEANSLEKLKFQNEHSTNGDTTSIEDQLSKYRVRQRIVKSLRAELRAGANSLEHVVQLVANILVILVSKSKTRTVVNLGEIFLSKIEAFLYLSTAYSFFSLIRGQMNYVVSRKDGFVGILGKIVLVIYFLLSTITRVSAVLLMLTPCLGLFDIMSHFKMSKYSFDLDFFEERAFDVGENNTIIEINSIWNKLVVSDLHDFTVLPDITFIVTPLILVVIHIILSCYLLRPLHGHKMKLFIQSLFTLISPPMFADWEEFKRCYPNLDILECWKRSQSIHRAFLTLFMSEHLICLIPLVVLKTTVDRRNSLLESSGFSPIKDEVFSTNIINWLLITWTIIFLITPIVQSLLARMYFKFCHGWSRILRVYLERLNNEVDDNSIKVGLSRMLDSLKYSCQSVERKPTEQVQLTKYKRTNSKRTIKTISGKSGASAIELRTNPVESQNS